MGEKNKNKISREIIKNIRKDLGYTQKEIADLAGMERSSYVKKENGITSLFADEFLKLWSLFHSLTPKKSSLCKNKECYLLPTIKEFQSQEQVKTVKKKG